MPQFIEKATELQPFMTCTVEGDPDPKKRRAMVNLMFFGEDALKKAQTLHAAIIADIQEVQKR